MIIGLFFSLSNLWHTFLSHLICDYKLVYMAETIIIIWERQKLFSLFLKLLVMIIVLFLWIIVGTILCMYIPYAFFFFLLRLFYISKTVPLDAMLLALWVGIMLWSLVIWYSLIWFTSYIHTTRFSRYQHSADGLIRYLDTTLKKYIHNTSLIHYLVLSTLAFFVPGIICGLYAKSTVWRMEFILCFFLGKFLAYAPAVAVFYTVDVDALVSGTLLLR